MAIIDLLIVVFTRFAGNLTTLFDIDGGGSRYLDYWPPCKKRLDLAE